MNLVDKRYDKKIVSKPWGYEYVIYRNKNDLCVTCLHIDYNKKTSLHCHPTKKTGFILLDGNANIQLGLYKSGIKKYNAPSKLMIRSGLFHQIQSKSKKGLIALEFETPYKKDDLVRFEDNYGRVNKPYERKINKIYKDTVIFKNNDFKNKKKYTFGTVQVSFEIHKNFTKLKKFSDKDIFAVLGGKVVDHRRRNILSYGDIVKTGTLRKLSEKFSISDPLKLIKVGKKL